MSADNKSQTDSVCSTDDTIIPISEWPITNTEIHNSRNNLKRKESSDSLEDRKKYKISHNTTKLALKSKINFKDREQALNLVDDEGNGNKEPPDISAKIARWWRQQRKQVLNHKIPHCGPASMLLHISRLAECRSFLENERQRLMRISDKRADVFSSLASIDDYTEKFFSALACIDQALELEPSCASYLWFKEKISRQCKMLRDQNNAIKRVENEKMGLQFPPVTKVPRVSSKTLTVSEFENRYLKAGKPVIITDTILEMTKETFDYSLVVEHAGKTTVTTKKATRDSMTWAQIENKRETTIGELIQDIQSGCAKDFLFDWSLPLHCPSLAEKLSLPSYFKNNYLLQTTPESLYRDSWPSLFIAPQGANTQLHVDAFHSHFWMALFQGEKRWTFFDEEDTAFLYPRWFQSMDPVFEVDLVQPDLKQFPLLALTKPQQCVLQPGELLFVPGGSPHFVENLSPTLAISSNYVDHTNFSKACDELKINALQDQRAADLLSQLEDPAFLIRVQNQRNKET